jgi:hypothetical protein
MTDSMLTAALSTAASGWPVFPCRPDAKEPLTRHGFQDATTEARIISMWWAMWPNANVAVPTGATTMDVLDVDNKGPGENGWSALRRVRDAGLATGAHRLIRTPRGGLHLYFRPSGNRNGSLPKHYLDLRGDGGYVLVPPSIVNGRPYELLEDRPDADGVLMWEDIRRLLNPPPRPTAARMATGDLATLARWLSDVTEGSRNNSLFWACCRAVEQGTACSAADLRPLTDIALSLGLTVREVEATAWSALRTYGVAA